MTSSGLPIDVTAAAFFSPGKLTPPFAWVEHIPFACWLVEQHRPKMIVELGTHSGNSYLAFCQTVAALHLPTRCFAVDTWKGDEHAGLYGEDIYDDLSRYHDQHYAAFSRLIRATFDDALPKFADQSIDLLHIDGLHTYEAVTHDLQSWLPKMSNRGIILMHDTNVRGNEFGVYRVWEEVSARYPHFEFLHSHGLGVLGVGADLSPQVGRLFAADADETSRQRVRDLFSQLGRVLTSQVGVSDERTNYERARAGWSELETHYNALTERTDKQAARLETAEQERAMLQRTVGHQSNRIDALEHERDAALAQLATLRQTTTQLMSRMPSPDVERSLRAGRSPREHVKTTLSRAARWAMRQAGQGGWRKHAVETAARGLRAVSPRIGRGLRRVSVDRAVLFDRDWYVARYPEVAAEGIDPFTHYVHVGMGLGYNPNPLFDTNWYLNNNPDVAAANLNPLTHFTLDGAAQGRDPSPHFDTQWYCAQNPDVAASGMNPLLHFLRVGAAAGLDPSPGFDTQWYLANNPDVAATGANPLVHFVQYGEAEGRLTRPPGVLCAGSEFFRIGREDRLGHIMVGRTGETAPPKSVRSVGIDELLPSGAVHARPAGAATVDVIVPVYRGTAETIRCIESVLATRDLNHAFGRLILIDDDTPEPDLRHYLAGVAKRDGVELVTNAVNAGFVASINRGIAAAGDNDVLLLNSDTEVNGNWLDRIALQAQADPRIATVTPFSNNATICSYPDIGGTPHLPDGLSLEEIDRACAQANSGRAVDLPTGVGFCMFVRRACLRAVGGFDEEAFGKGYGEETDFCQRALRKGWRNVLAGDVFVFHVGETSFGSSTSENKARAEAVMARRHPSYGGDVARWLQSDPAMALRLSVTAALWKSSARPVILHILHSGGGGTEKYVSELVDKVGDVARHLVLIGQKVNQHIAFSLLLPETYGWRSVAFTAGRMADVAPIMRSFGVTQVHVHHFLEIFDQVSSLVEHIGAPYDLSIHDYTTICPRIHLTRNERGYCGEPNETGCLRCLSEGGHKLSSDILWWRNFGSILIGDANRVLCPSLDVARRIGRYVPEARLVVVPHEENLYHPGELRAPEMPAEKPLRVAVLGIMAEHKGGTYLLDCIEIAKQRGIPIAWHLIGDFPPPLALRARSSGDVLSITGRYDIDELPRIMGDIQPHLVFFPQRCPETYSYTLSEAFSAGIPVVVPDIGAFTERAAGHAGCTIYPTDLPPDGLVTMLVGLRGELALARMTAPAAPPAPQLDAIPVEGDFYRTRYVRQAA